MKKSDVFGRLNCRVVGVACLLAVTASLSCSKAGQSDSEASPEDGDGGVCTVSCPCEPPGTFLKVQVLERSDDVVSLEVQEVLHGHTPFVVGSVFDARWDGRLPCYTGNTDLVAGETALAMYVEHADCRNGGEAGSATAGVDCVGPESNGFEVSLTPWSSQLVFAESSSGQVTVPRENLSDLWESNECRSNYGDWSDLVDQVP